ncbi:unnamed protein product [Paramecium octaurelia]|uniref:Uncharacterized protein n=1 Tax=Paramecium octaurelia TaxID=43137 RepID=A0A8S1TDJ6_PAROT|nr:unnamed protein product [Paramecium octaurelia]
MCILNKIIGLNILLGFDSFRFSLTDDRGYVKLLIQL